MTKKFNLQDIKLTYLPAQPSEVLLNIQSLSTPAQQLKMRRKSYTETIRCILWPVVVSRPDATFQIGILSQFVQNPGQAHWNALKRVMSYLNTTKDLWLTLGGEGKKKPVVYTDIDWASQSDCHSISGYGTIIGTEAVTWSSKKQQIIALLSTESEYIGQTYTLKEILWIRQFLGELTADFNRLTVLYSDNQGTIALAKNNKFHARLKHINIHYHFIREAVENQQVNLTYVPTAENIVDMFMKPLVVPKFTHFHDKLGLVSA
jgi:hypothetical protein